MDKRRRERQAPFSRSDERHRSTLNVFRLCSLRSSRKGKEKGWGGRGAGGEGLDDVRAQGPPLAIKSRGSSTRFHTKIIFIALPTCVPPLCATRRSRQRERETASPFNLGTGSRYAGQNNCLATWNLLQWMERERERIPTCRFFNIFFFLQILESYTSSIPCNKFLHLPPFYLSINLRQ